LASAGASSSVPLEASTLDESIIESLISGGGSDGTVDLFAEDSWLADDPEAVHGIAWAPDVPLPPEFFDPTWAKADTDIPGRAAPEGETDDSRHDHGLLLSPGLVRRIRRGRREARRRWGDGGGSIASSVEAAVGDGAAVDDDANADDDAAAGDSSAPDDTWAAEDGGNARSPRGGASPPGLGRLRTDDASLAPLRRFPSTRAAPLPIPGKGGPSPLSDLAPAASLSGKLTFPSLPLAALGNSPASTDGVRAPTGTAPRTAGGLVGAGGSGRRQKRRASTISADAVSTPAIDVAGNTTVVGMTREAMWGGIGLAAAQIKYMVEGRRDSATAAAAEAAGRFFPPETSASRARLGSRLSETLSVSVGSPARGGTAPPLPTPRLSGPSPLKQSVSYYDEQRKSVLQ
jgi:hypothetical protein